MKKILVVEDNPGSRVICSCLELLSVGYKKITVKSDFLVKSYSAGLVIIVCRDVDRVKSVWSQISDKTCNTPVAIAVDAVCDASESYALSCGFIGVIALNRKIDSVVKAVDALTRGDLWYSRSALEGHVKNQLVTRRSAATVIFSPQSLTVRERKVATLSCQGLGNKEIAQSLNISPYTVKTHMQKILKKSGVKNRTQLSAAFVV